MPRTARASTGGIYYHVLNSGNRTLWGTPIGVPQGNSSPTNQTNLLNDGGKLIATTRRIPILLAAFPSCRRGENLKSSPSGALLRRHAQCHPPPPVPWPNHPPAPRHRSNPRQLELLDPATLPPWPNLPTCIWPRASIYTPVHIFKPAPPCLHCFPVPRPATLRYRSAQRRPTNS